MNLNERLFAAETAWRRSRDAMDASTFNGRCRTDEAKAEVDRLRKEVALLKGLYEAFRQVCRAAISATMQAEVLDALSRAAARLMVVDLCATGPIADMIAIAERGDFEAAHRFATGGGVGPGKPYIIGQ